MLHFAKYSIGYVTPMMNHIVVYFIYTEKWSNMCIIMLFLPERYIKMCESLDQILSKSLLTPDYERRYIPKRETVRSAKLHRKIEREKTKGSHWFDMPATELTDERKRDLELVRMRNSLDSKTHYKSNDNRNVLPKYFQVSPLSWLIKYFGKVVDNPTEFYSARVAKKDRKRTIVDELLADEHFLRKNKKRYDDIKAREQMTRRGAFQHDRYPKKKKARTDV